MVLSDPMNELKTSFNLQHSFWDVIQMLFSYFVQIGHLAKGLNPPSANMLYFHGSYLPLAIKTGIVTGILSLTEGIAVGRTFAALKNYQVDGNKEMMAIGLMNMAGSCSSCYVTTGKVKHPQILN